MTSLASEFVTHAREQPVDLLTCPDLCSGWRASQDWLMAVHEFSMQGHHHVEVWRYCFWCGAKLITEQDRELLKHK